MSLDRLDMDIEGWTHRQPLESQSCGRSGKLFMKKASLERSHDQSGREHKLRWSWGTTWKKALVPSEEMSTQSKGVWVVLMAVGP